MGFLIVVCYVRSLAKKKMVKAVAVLTGKEGVSGTVYFSQEGDGKVFCNKLKVGLYG